MLAKHRAGTGPRWRRRLIGVAAVLPLAGTGLAVQVLASAPSALADTGHCLVTNDAIRTSYPNLQAAINAAGTGATLRVRGICTGTSSISTSLTITGQPGIGFSTPTLNGEKQGTVLTVNSGATVTINALTITDGDGLFGGGIYDNGGTVTLNHSVVTRNTGGIGGGIDNFGTVTLNYSLITGNTANDGGGIYNFGTLTMTTTAITGNKVESGGFGGGIDSEIGTVTMNGVSTIVDNSAELGGGVFNDDSETLTMNSRATISRNTASSQGGGVYNNGGTVTMNDHAAITYNTAGDTGGGIWNRTDGKLNGPVPGRGGNVYGNRPNDIVTAV